MPPRAILILGNGGCTAGDNWLPSVKRELTALGLDVVNHTFPANVKARASQWLADRKNNHPILEAPTVS